MQDYCGYPLMTLCVYHCLVNFNREMVKVYVAILSMMTMTQPSLWRVHWKMETLSTSPSLLTEDILPSLKSAMQLEPGIYLALTSVRYEHVHAGLLSDMKLMALV